jgi:hypothetical protein
MTAINLPNQKKISLTVLANCIAESLHPLPTEIKWAVLVSDKIVHLERGDVLELMTEKDFACLDALCKQCKLPSIVRFNELKDSLIEAWVTPYQTALDGKKWKQAWKPFFETLCNAHNPQRKQHEARVAQHDELRELMQRGEIKAFDDNGRTAKDINIASILMADAVAYCESKGWPTTIVKNAEYLETLHNCASPLPAGTYVRPYEVAKFIADTLIKYADPEHPTNKEREKHAKICQGHVDALVQAIQTSAITAFNENAVKTTDYQLGTVIRRTDAAKYAAEIGINFEAPAATNAAPAQEAATSAPEVVVIDSKAAAIFTHSTKVRRNTLTPVIELAQKKCRDPNDTAEVWAALQTLAQQKIAPLIGATEDGLQYLKNGDAANLSRNALRLRLRRLAPFSAV